MSSKKLERLAGGDFVVNCGDFDDFVVLDVNGLKTDDCNWKLRLNKFIWADCDDCVNIDDVIVMSNCFL